jgi:hypothetical protein
VLIEAPKKGKRVRISCGKGACNLSSPGAKKVYLLSEAYKYDKEITHTSHRSIPQ